MVPEVDATAEDDDRDDDEGCSSCCMTLLPEEDPYEYPPMVVEVVTGFVNEYDDDGWMPTP